MSTVPDSLKTVLQQTDVDALTAANEQGRVHVFIKLPHEAIRLIKGPLLIRHFLFLVPMPTAPVAGWFFEILVNPHPSFRMNTYFNIWDRDQARDFKQLAHQRIVPLYFLDGDDLSIVATKNILPPPDAERVFQEALICAERISSGRCDFDRAKADFQREYSLDEIAGWQLPGQECYDAGF